MESNAAVTLHFEDLAVDNYLFLKYVFLRISVTLCKKGKKCPFWHTIRVIFGKLNRLKGSSIKKSILFHLKRLVILC